MNRIRDFRLARDWSMQQLADASGTSKSQIDKLEKGDRRLTVDWMVRIAKALECDPRALMPGAAPQLSYKTLNPPADPALIPVRGPGDTIIDHVPRPYYLAHAKDAYALYVEDDRMAPMYRPRQLLFITPYKPPVPGNGIVVTDKSGAIKIRQYLRPKSSGILVREYQPTRKDTPIATRDIASLHVVVGTVEP